MALDGITLGLVKNELKNYIIGSKIEKVHQPSKNELVLILRTRNGGYRLYLSCDGQSAVIIPADARVTVKRSRKYASFIKIKPDTFIDVLNKKISG